MAENNVPSRAETDSVPTNDESSLTDYVERNDVGVSLTVKLK